MTTDLARLVQRMDTAAETTLAAANALARDLEETRLLAAEDRIQISRLIMLVTRLTAQGASTLDGTNRLERTAAHVAEDLAASIERADEAPSEIPGAGADAALRSPGETAAEAAEAADAAEAAGERSDTTGPAAVTLPAPGPADIPGHSG